MLKPLKQWQRNTNAHPDRPSQFLPSPHTYSGLYAPAPSAMLAVPADDADAGVCVVCEDECTCGAAKASGSAAKRLNSNYTASRFDSSTAYAFASKAPVSSAAVDSAPHHVPQPSSSSTLPTKKKRGRPSKADLAARELAARAAAEAAGLKVTPASSDPTYRPHSSTKPRPSSTKLKARKSLALSNGPISKAVRPKPIPKKKTKVAAPRPFKTKSRIIFSSSESDDNDEYSDHSTKFPTFVPASVLGPDAISNHSSSSLSSAEEVDNNGNDDDDDEDDDSSIAAEEEQHIIAEETLAMRKLRMRRERERFNEHLDTGGQRWDQMHWNSRERHASIEADDVADADSGTESDDDESSEDDAADEDDDAEPDGSAPDFLLGHADAFTRFSEDEEDYDAEVFFANLSDSSFGSSSSDSEQEREHEVPATVQSETEGGNPFEGLTLSEEEDLVSAAYHVLTEDWDGQRFLTRALFDVDGEGASGSHFDAAAARGMQEAMTDTAMDTVGEYDDEGDDTEMEDESGVEYEDETEADGNTTAEEDVDDSLKALTPPPAKVAAVHFTSFAEVISPEALPVQSHLPDKGGPLMGAFVLSLPQHANPLPPSAVIDETRAMLLPSPYAHLRKRRSGWRARMRSNSDVFSARQASLPPPPSLPSTELAQTVLSDPDTAAIESAPEFLPPRPVDLDDLLNSTLLGDHDASDSNADEPEHFKRWSRVPIGTYRFRRRLEREGSETEGARADINDLTRSAMMSPLRVSDGFSYGSQGPGLVATSPYTSSSSMLWEPSPGVSGSSSNRTMERRGSRARKAINSVPSDTDGGGSVVGGAKLTKRKVMVSPVILPLKEDDVLGMSLGSPMAGVGNPFETMLDMGSPSKKQRRSVDLKRSSLYDAGLSGTPIASTSSTLTSETLSPSATSLLSPPPLLI